MKKKLSFPPELRLRKARDFSSMRAGARKVHSRNLTVIFRENELTNPRIGIVISKKVDKHANRRNRFKRVIRELFRIRQHDFKRSVDIIVIVKGEIRELTFAEIERQFIGSLQFNGVLKAQPAEPGVGR